MHYIENIFGTAYTIVVIGVDRQVLTEYYASGKSMWEISKLLSCSVHRVTYWMKKYNITKRTRSEAAYVKQNPKGDPYTIKTNLTMNETFLFGLGIGIFWGEGNKKHTSSVRVANSDPHIILTFRKFLLEICQLKPQKILYSIVCFNDSDPNVVAAYWSNLLEYPISSFGKIVQIQSRGKGTYNNKSSFGVCTLSVGNLHLKQWIDSQLNIIKKPR